MASHQHSTKRVSLAAARVQADPVLTALKAMETAGVDDAAYGAARDRFERAKPLTAAGASAQRAAIVQILAEMGDDALTVDGLAALCTMAANVQAFERRTG